MHQVRAGTLPQLHPAAQEACRVSALPVPVSFATLHEVGYTACVHFRVKKARCMDCGAYETLAGWMGGTMDFPRLPWDNEKPPKSGPEKVGTGL